MQPTEQKKDKAKGKKPYSRPELKIFGSVTELTRASERGFKNDGGAPGPHKIS